MRIAWFSPLPPLQTEIGRWSANLLPEVAAITPVTVWAPSGSERIDGSRLAFRPLQLDRNLWRLVNQQDVSIFNMGNNSTFHEEIATLALAHPGVLILHDTVLEHFWLSYLQRHPRAVAMAFRSPDRSPVDAIHNHLLRSAAHVIVHSHVGYEAVAAVQPNVTFLPLAAAPSQSPPRPAIKRLGPVHLICFGYLGENRCLTDILEALAGLEERDQFRLDLYGVIAGEEHVRQRIQALGLGDLVTIRGFVSEEALAAALDAADLAINLRNPTMGEASASQLRIWNHRLPSIVSDAGWYAEQPADTVAKVSSRDIVQGLQNHLRAFLDDRSVYLAMGERSRLHLEANHDPKNYAARLIEIAAGVQSRSGDAALADLRERTVNKAASLVGSHGARLLSGNLDQAFNDLARKSPLPAAARVALPGRPDRSQRRRRERKVSADALPIAWFIEQAEERK